MQKILSIACLLVFIVACQSKPNREPNVKNVDFDREKVALLKWAAQQRILFQMSDSVFKDVQIASLDSSCKKLETPAWSEAVFSTLSTLKENRGLHGKVRVIEIKRGEKPYVSTSQDLDGLNYLIIGYAKNERVSLVHDISDVPCGESVNSFMNRKKLTVTFEYPTSQNILSVVQSLKQNEVPDRWKFKTGFLIHLAERLTVFRTNPELSFERSAQGDSFLAAFLNEQDSLVAKSQFSTFEYWLTELSLRSHSASYLKIFTLIKNKELTYGMGSIEGSQGLSYPYLTYRVKDGHYTYPSLSQLDKCLNDLSFRYKRSLASIGSDISTNSDNFLYPGYTCRAEF